MADARRAGLEADLRVTGDVRRAVLAVPALELEPLRVLEDELAVRDVGADGTELSRPAARSRT